MTRSAIVVVVESAEAVVSDHRRVHDPMAARGVPAHITILHPFRSVVDERTATQVAAVAQQISPLVVTFATVGRFPGGLVFLAPEPEEELRRIIRLFVDTFPDCPPYGGTIPDPTPHLTVGTGLIGDRADELEAALAPRLPISTVVDRLTLLVEDNGGNWSVDRSWPLRGA